MPSVPMSQATIENLLKWNTDLASVNTAVQANLKVASSAAQAASAAQGIGTAATQMTQLGVATDKTAQSVGYLAQRLEQAARVRSFQGDATGGLRDAAFGGSAGGGNQALVRGLFNARQAAIALPGVGYQSPLTLGIRGLEIVAEKTGASVGKLATGIGVVGAAAVAVAIAFDRFNQQLEDSKKLLAGALAAQKNYYDALGTLTTDQVDEQIATLQRLRPIIQQQVDELQNALDSAFAQAQQTPLGDIGARALFNQLPTGALKEALDEAQAALNENIQSEARLTQGREAGAFATNDAAAAEQELADIRKQLSEAHTNQQLREVDAIIAAERMTSEERAARLSIVRAELDLTQQFIDAGGASVDTQLELIDRQKDLEAEYYALTSVTDSYTDKLERLNAAQEALSTQTDNYFDALEREGAIRDQITAITQDLNDALSDSTRKIADANIDKLERLTEVEADTADRRIEIAENSADRIASIERRAAYNREVAISNLDAVAFDRAKKQAELEKKDQEDQDKQQLERLDKQLAKQEASIEKSYQNQLRSIEDAYTREVNIKNRALLQANTDLQNLTYAQQEIALWGANNQRVIATQLQTDLANIFLSGAANIIRGVGSFLINGPNATAQGYNYSAGVYPSSFTGTPFPTGSQVQQIATQAARSYVYDVMLGGRWITAN